MLFITCLTFAQNGIIFSQRPTRRRATSRLIRWKQRHGSSRRGGSNGRGERGGGDDGTSGGDGNGGGHEGGRRGRGEDRSSRHATEARERGGSRRRGLAVRGPPFSATPAPQPPLHQRATGHRGQRGPPSLLACARRGGWSGGRVRGAHRSPGPLVVSHAEVRLGGAGRLPRAAGACAASEVRGRVQDQGSGRS